MKRILALFAVLSLALASAAYADGAGCSDKAKAEKNKSSTLIDTVAEVR
ncbi:MAG: hypothetical protein JNK68_13235 [Betaproteobacteria bacterium]|nr:hypothetical protein [Betaproteobacteria bacterium]